MTCKHEPVMQGSKRLHVAVIPIDYGAHNVNGQPTLNTDCTIEACVCMHCFAVYIPEDSMGELGKIAAGGSLDVHSTMLAQQELPDIARILEQMQRDLPDDDSG